MLTKSAPEIRQVISGAFAREGIQFAKRFSLDFAYDLVSFFFENRFRTFSMYFLKFLL